MDEELRNLIEGAKKQGANDNDVKRIIDLYIADSKKKGVSEPTVQKKQLDSRAQQKTTPISSDTEETQPLVESDGLGGQPKSFPKRDSNIKSVMYGDGIEQPNVLVQSLPISEKPKKYYRLVSEQKKEVDKKITELEDRNIRLGRRPEDLAREGTYQSLIKTKQQLDSEFKPAELAINEIKKETPTWTRPIERLISSATDGKYSLANTETIKLNKEVEDKLIDSFDDAPEETRQKWYKGSLPLEQKEKIINNAKIDVLNNTFNSLKKETSDYIKNVKDNPSISDDEKSLIRNEIKAKSDAFNAQVALDFSGNLLKNNFKRTNEDKNLDETILSKYEGFIPESADAISRLVEGAISVGGKALTGIPTLALLGAERFNQLIGTSKPEDYTPTEATIDLINDTTNYNFLPSSKSEKGAIVGEDGKLNLSYRSITRTLADTLPFTLQIINSVKKGRVEGSPQSMVSQLLNPSKNKAFSDNLRAAETAYKVTIGDNYKEAKDLGMDDSKAFTYSNVMSLAEGVSESIMPDFKYFDSLTGATLKNVFKGNLKEAVTKQAVKNVTKDFFKNVASEIGEEEFSLAVEDGLKYSLLLNHENSEFFNIKKQKELVAATVIMSGAIGGYAVPGKFTQNKKDIYNSIHKNIYELQDSFNNEINSPLNDDKAKETLKKAYVFASEVSNAISNAPENVTADQIDLLVKKKSLEEKKKTIDTAFHPDINEEIDSIDTKIRELSKQPVIPEEETTEPITKQPDVSPTEEVVAEEIKPIRQLGNGSNVYFETEKHRLNENQYGDKGKYVLNVGEKGSELPKDSLYFDDLNEAISIAKKIETDFPNGVPDAILLDKVIENYKKEVTPTEITPEPVIKQAEVTPTEEVISPEPIVKKEIPTTPKEVKSKYDVTYDDNGNITKITTKKGVEVNKFIEYEVFDKKIGKKVTKLMRNPGYTQIEAKILGVITNNKSKVEQEKLFRDALDKFAPTTEYEVALEALAKGIKVSNPKQETGDKAGWVTDKKADSIEVLAEKLATDYPNLDEQSIRAELIDIINSNDSLAKVRDKLVSTTDENSAKLKQREADAFLSGLTEKEFAMYEAMKAEDDYISELSDEEAINYYQELYKQQDEGQIDESTSIKGISTEEVSGKQKEAFRDKIKDIPESGKVSKYLSGETIERVEGETPRNAQEIDVMPLVEAGIHGKETVEMAKEIYGDKYIEKTLEFLDSANLKAHEKALLYVSLENEMFDLVNSEPDNVGLKKLQDLVRVKSQQFLRESSLAINMGRLRAIMKDGFNYESITDKFLSTNQLIAKKEIEKAIQSNADEIQKEYELIVSESDIEQLVLSGVEKQINEIYNKLPTARKVKADKAVAALERIQKKLKGKAYDATIGIPIALIDSGITIIKNSIKAGVSIADAIEIGINHIKEKYGKEWSNEGMFRDDMTQGFKSEGISEKEIKAKELTNKQIVNQALIDAGFGREISVKGVKRNVLDWKKLAGEEGSVVKLKENVEKIIGKEAAKELEDEYNNLRASVIEKSLKELERRNIPRKKVNLKTSAKKLAEIYNYGAFEKDSDTYDKVMNTVLGMNQLDQESFNEAKKLAKSLAELFSQKDSNGNQLSQDYLKHGERVINKQIERLLSKVAWSESNGVYKATVIAKEFVGLAQRNALVSVGQAVENTTSGYISRAFKKIAFMFDNVDTKSLKKSRNKLARMTFKDITLGGGLEFGDVTSPFITKSKTMDLIVNASDSRLYHALVSTALGKPFLESADSMHKAALAQGFFHYNLIKILRKKGYSKTEAKNYVSEQLTGQSFEDALVTSKKIIDKINESAGKKVIPDSKESIYRFANDLVNEALVQGNNITLDELEASLKSAETVAGFELGHEPNNIISKPLNLFNSWVQTRTDKAVKDKKWNDAAALTAASIVTTNILNPYVGGGTNWTLLAAQKAGIPTLSTIYWNIKSRGSKLDLSTEEGIKNLEKDLKYQLLAKNANARMFIGAAVTLAAFALAKSTGADDDLYEWLKKNPWANKYMKKVNPPAVQFMLAQEDKKLGEFLGQQMNIKADAFDEGKKLQRALKNAASGKTQQALGGVGQLAGSRLSTPIIPWRVVKDVRDIYRGLNGLPEIKHEFKASGFASGYFQGGMIEQLGLRPEDVKDETSGRQSSGSRSDSGSRGSSGSRSQSGSRE